MYGEIWDAFPRECKQPQYDATQFVWFHFPVCRWVFLYFHTTSYEAYSFTTDGYMTFNMCTNLGACYTHKVRRGVRHKQVCTRVDLDRQKNLFLTLPFRFALSYVPRICTTTVGLAGCHTLQSAFRHYQETQLT